MVANRKRSHCPQKTVLVEILLCLISDTPAWSTWSAVIRILCPSHEKPVISQRNRLTAKLNTSLFTVHEFKRSHWCPTRDEEEEAFHDDRTATTKCRHPLSSSLEINTFAHLVGCTCSNPVHDFASRERPDTLSITVPQSVHALQGPAISHNIWALLVLPIQIQWERSHQLTTNNCLVPLIDSNVSFDHQLPLVSQWVNIHILNSVNIPIMNAKFNDYSLPYW